MKRAPRSRQRHDLYAKYHDYDSEISDLLGECGGKLPEETAALLKIEVGYVLATLPRLEDEVVKAIFKEAFD